MSETQSTAEVQTHAGAQFFCRQLTMRGFESWAPAPCRILVAGCGAGHEAAAIADYFESVVDAIDLDLRVDPAMEGKSNLRFQAASICETPFEPASFDAIFYHHVIEHVNDPPGSLKEIARILKPRGFLFVGTPNRHRLVSSVGAHKQTDWESTFSNKLKDNLRDWSQRLTGRFRNELGAHAGFSQGELDRLLAPYFPKRDWLTSDYLNFKYADKDWRSLVRIAGSKPLRWFAAPSIYVMARK